MSSLVFWINFLLTILIEMDMLYERDKRC